MGWHGSEFERMAELNAERNYIDAVNRAQESLKRTGHYDGLGPALAQQELTKYKNIGEIASFTQFVDAWGKPPLLL